MGWSALHDAIVLQVVSSTQDHTRNANRTTSKTFFIQPNRSDGTFTVIASAAQDVSPEIIATAVSPSSKLTAILRETNSADKKRFVEIWEGERLEASVDVTKAHGVFYTDGKSLDPPLSRSSKHRAWSRHAPQSLKPLPPADQLSTLAFSPSETSLVYTAEANAPENNNTDDLFSKFRFLPDYGERYVGRKRPTLFLARWAHNAESLGALAEGVTPTVHGITVPATSNASISFGQAQFVTDDILLATGYEFSEDGRRLGIMACYNRPTAIWELKLDLALCPQDTIVAFSATKISDPSRASRSPRPIPGTSAALWLSHELGGPHASCFSLHKFALHTRDRGDVATAGAEAPAATVLVPVVDKIRDGFMDGFAGLYVDSLLARPFVRTGGRAYLLTRTSQRSRLEVILVDLEQPESVVRLTPAESSDDLWSWSPLATDGRKWVLASRSAPTVPNELVLGRLEEHGGRPRVTWQVIEMPPLTRRGEQPDIDKTIGRL